MFYSIFFVKKIWLYKKKVVTLRDFYRFEISVYKKR